ncbi:cell agglutination protein Mam3 [Collariella sp. IMI 366227]|nr:cell agglutination protein Mam3 [Collariella sp. IMI 366227]
MRGIPKQPNGLLSVRTTAVGLARLLALTISTAYAAPLGIQGHGGDGDAPEAEGASRWVLYVASLVLVLSGGAFAGLTIALMGQDGIYLQVMAGDPSEPQQKNARRVYDLLKKGKHWTLPVVLDRCLGGGVAAVVGSTFLIVIFGEVLPQSVCVRYGLQIGGYMSKPVLAMMYLMAPIAWPTAKLLDWILGEDHGTVYKKSGLKTLVTLHKNLGEVSQRLNQDEVTIISAEKPVANVMTPMDDVFVMAEDTVLDEPTMDMILSAGYSRIPIHETGNPTNFVGMLLVKILITYDPEDCKLVRDFPLATLPETRPETSCLDIVNFFQEGKSHMVLVSENPGEDHGALGVVTLEDVIEELIGEEIIDESDVYIDVHKAIRRLTPAPKARVQRRQSEDPNGRVDLVRYDSDSVVHDAHKAAQTAGSASFDSPMLSSSPKTATLMMRRSSAGLDGHFVRTTVPVRANFQDIKQHLKHLGPSNPAANPRHTHSTTVKIKPSSGTHSAPLRSSSIVELPAEQTPADEGDETTSLLKPQVSGKDGIIQALQHSYGSVSPAVTVQHAPQQTNGSVPRVQLDSDEHANKSTQTSAENSLIDLSSTTEATPPKTTQQPQQLQQQNQQLQSKPSSSSGESATSLKTENTLVPKRPYVRSGSITENVVESRGVRKVVLETTHAREEEADTAAASAVVAAASPDQPRLLGRTTFGFFGRGKGDEEQSGKGGEGGEG